LPLGRTAFKSDDLFGQVADMNSVNLADAKARLGELVDQAGPGEVIQIIRRGKPVAQIMAIAEKREPLDLGLLRKLGKSLPFDNEPAGEFVRRMRDEDRY
jgi:prevent-host-death family protein